MRDDRAARRHREAPARLRGDGRDGPLIGTPGAPPPARRATSPCTWASPPPIRPSRGQRRGVRRSTRPAPPGAGARRGGAVPGGRLAPRRAAVLRRRRARRRALRRRGRSPGFHHAPGPGGLGRGDGD
ncbi:hypothetical protein V2I01_05085 [Micromonospora sp. BRA006-A]|nr:hypothetical protein [Micromonospora sp. BRA006-A]